MWTGGAMPNAEPDSGDRAMKPAAMKPEITLADLDRIDIRVGTIRKVADMPMAWIRAWRCRSGRCPTAPGPDRRNER
jgi:hypothetical protein